jgi:hypothetical protein
MVSQWYAQAGLRFIVPCLYLGGSLTALSPIALAQDRQLIPSGPTLENASNQSGASENSSPENASSKNASSEHGASKDASSKDASSKNESRENASTTEASSKNESNKNASNENALSQNASNKNGSSENTSNKKASSQYQMAPRVVPDHTVGSDITKLNLNGAILDHRSKGEARSGADFGDGRSTDFTFSTTVRLKGEIKQSLTRNNVFTLEQRGEYFQAMPVLRSRELTIEQRNPYTLLGQHIQMSLVANCTLPGTDPRQKCTYTPGLVIDRSFLDPTFLIPTRVKQTAKMGDEVTPESMAEMAKPGFQRGGGGQEVALDVLLINSGAYPGNSQSQRMTVNRQENLAFTPATFYSRVHQVVRANATEAAIGRTIRGNGLVWGDENLALNALVQLATAALPDAIPTLQGSDQPPNLKFNKNLLFAMNNLRLPEGGLTFYQAGVGRSATPAQKAPEKAPENAAPKAPENAAPKAPENTADVLALPKATYNGLWVGLSPVMRRSFSSSLGYELTSARRILSQGGGEGGINDTVKFVSVVNSDRFSSNNLEDFYTQVYLTVFEHDADLVSRSRQMDRLRYYPHISYLGNVTRSDSVLRYYMGAILADSFNAYVGADFSRSTQDGWNYSLGGIGYINPDFNNYSRMNARLSKQFRLSDRASFLVGTRAVWAIDQDTKLQDLDTSGQGSSVVIEARGSLSPVSVGFTRVFGQILPNSVASSSMLDTSLQLGPQLFLTGFITLMDEKASSSRYGVGAQWKFNPRADSPVVSIAWRNTRYDYGMDAFRNEIRVSDNTFSVGFRMTF